MSLVNVSFGVLFVMNFLYCDVLSVVLLFVCVVLRVVVVRNFCNCVLELIVCCVLCVYVCCVLVYLVLMLFVCVCVVSVVMYVRMSVLR